MEIILQGSGSDLSVCFHESIRIPANYEAKIGLKNFVTYNNMSNVDDTCNRILIKVPGSARYQILSFDKGAYEVDTLNAKMQAMIQQDHPDLEDVEKNFKLVGNEATQRAEFVFKEDYGVDFDTENSIHALLGFDRTARRQGRGIWAGEGIVDIMRVTQLIFLCNITDCNYLNDAEIPLLYNCGVNVSPGYRLSREIENISYKHLTTNQISIIRVWLVDQHQRRVDLRGDELLVTLSLQIRKLSDV